MKMPQVDKVKIHDLEFEVFLTTEQVRETIKKLGDQITQDYLEKKPIFIAVLNGAYVFAADLLRECKFPCEMSFVKLSSYEGLESTGSVAMNIGLNLDLKDRHVIILEDIIDTGGTLHYFLKKVTEFQPASIRLAALLVKPEALKHPLKIDYTGFEIPNRFVVGYGLDYNEEGRNLSAIYQLSED